MHVSQTPAVAEVLIKAQAIVNAIDVVSKINVILYTCNYLLVNSIINMKSVTTVLA